MTRGLGFTDLKDEGEGETTLRLPPKKASRPSALPKAELARESAELGFVSREPAREQEDAVITPARPRGRRRVPQGKLLVAGRQDVLDRFQQFCWDRDIAYWEGLRLLLDGSGPGRGTPEEDLLKDRSASNSLRP